MKSKGSSHVDHLAWLLSLCTRQEDGCLTYDRRRVRGYGAISYEGKSWRTHRLRWHLEYGSIPEGMSILHHCDNPPCLEIAHLYVGTQAQNMNDRLVRGRGLGVPLTEDQKIEIARRYEHQHVKLKTPGNSCRELCDEFNVSQGRLLKIVRDYWGEARGEQV